MTDRLTIPPVSDAEYGQRCLSLANMLTKRPERHDQFTFGQPKPENECGTAACVAGWAQFTARKIVSINVDGEMTWDTKNLADYDAPWDTRYEGVPTLARFPLYHLAPDEGAAWLGLGSEMKEALFYNTINFCSQGNLLAVAILRRLADGRLSRDQSLSEDEMEEILASADPVTGE